MALCGFAACFLPGKLQTKVDASHRSTWRMSQPQVKTELILHLTHIFICVPWLMLRRYGIKLWWKGCTDRHINTFGGRAASPQDDAYSWSLQQSHSTFPHNTGAMVIQTYCRLFQTLCQVCAVKLLDSCLARNSFRWFIVSFFYKHIK